MSTTASSPEKLTISCALTTLSVEDKATLQDKIWLEKAETLWLGLKTFTWDGIPEQRLVEAPTEYEAMIKLYQTGFFYVMDFYMGIECELPTPPDRISRRASSMEIRTHIKNIHDEVCRLKGKETIPIRKLLPPEYNITKLSEIPKV